MVLSRTVALHHHERWDGTGYPSAAAGADIPLSARVAAVADSFAAMIQHRPYRAAMTLEAARAEIHRPPAVISTQTAQPPLNRVGRELCLTSRPTVPKSLLKPETVMIKSLSIVAAFAALILVQPARW